MSNEKIFYARINGKNISNIIGKIYDLFEKNENVSNGEICKDPDLGTISYSLIDYQIKISFSNLNKEFFILRQYIYLINEKKIENKLLIFTKPDLEQAFKKYSNSYYFLINNIIVSDINKILEAHPSTIMLRLKEDPDISLEIFKSLNNKYNISNEDSIIMKTNELISQDIYSLGIYRDSEINLVIKKRNKLIDEIKNFMNDIEEVIMKIYGVDGIGKSMTFVYLTSLKNDFKIIYFNLKEFYLKERLELINLFKSQLANYYTEQISNSEENSKEIDMINKNTFNDYTESMKQFEEKISYKNEVNFWYLLDIFLEMISKNYRMKVLLIIDQYKIENDKENKLYNLEKNLIENISNIKLLVVSSLNDMRVKTEFIGILKNLSNLKSKKLIKKVEINRDEPNSITEEKIIEDIFKDFPENNLEKDDSFTKIKKFEDKNVDIKKEINKKKDSNNEDITENIYIDKIEKFFNNQKFKIYKNNKKYRIIYINDLISIKDMKSENKKIQNKLKEFNYNPKYYNKFKNNVNSPITKKSLNEAYDSFLMNQFENIKSKILDFYEKFSTKFDINLKDRDIGLMLIQLRMIVEEKIDLDFDSLIYYLNKFPIKYLKIIQIDDTEDNNFLRLNENISNYKFRIEYIFPFLKFVINRLLYEYGNNRCIKCSDLPPSGIGSFLEKQIRREILINKIFDDFHCRNVWNFQISLYKNTKLSNKKKKIKGKKKSKKNNENEQMKIDQKKDEKEEKEEEEEEEKEKEKKKEGEMGEGKEEEGEMGEEKEEENIKTKIDFFNLKELTYDDQQKNPLNDFNCNYYIICHSSNNNYLDSIILIPCSQDNQNDKIFNLIALQITINKWKIYGLDEYHKATETAAQKISSIYDIRIKDKFFCFVLSEEYENKATQQNLDKLGIPFVFFSTAENCFFLETKEKIESLCQFLNNEFKLSTNQNKKESVFYKNNIFKKMENYLQKKRKRDKKFKITQNSFNFIKEKMFKGESQLILPKEKIDEIIEKLKNAEFFKSKNIIIEYMFKVKFSESKKLDLFNDDLVGICFYKKNIFLFNNKLGSKIKTLSKNKKEKNILNVLLNYINDM